VITTNEGKKVAIGQINRSVKTVVNKAVKKGIIDENATSHSLRKSFAGYLHFEKGVAGKVIQELLGHANFKTTEESYLKVNKKDVKEEILSIDMLGTNNEGREDEESTKIYRD
jgi:site-specific recombinase XerD